MPDQRNVDDLTLEELEAVVEQRRRIERARHFAENPVGGRFRPITIMPVETEQAKPLPVDRVPKRFASWRERLLLLVEIIAVLALVAIVVSSLFNLQRLNEEVVQARQSGSANRSTTEDLPGSSFPPPSQSAELPGSSFPPEPAPAALGVELQAVAAIPVPTPGPRSPTRIVIPSINVDWPVVEGDGWEELKQGIGHRAGSANPGERGNLVLSGHNDVYGEPFRDLERLDIGKEVLVYAGSNAFRYVIKARRVVQPNELSVLAPSRDAIITLITCAPYRIDTQRLILIGELAH